MFKVSIIKNNVVTNINIVSSEAEGLAWIEQENKSLSFGKPERWVNDLQEDVSGALETRVTEIETAEGPKDYTEYRLPAEYSYTIEDITEQVLKEKSFQEGLKRQELGSRVIAKIYQINESKNITAQEFATILQDQTMLNIERLLKNGSLKTAKLLITNLNSSFYTQAEKNEVLEMLADF